MVLPESLSIPLSNFIAEGPVLGSRGGTGMEQVFYINIFGRSMMTTVAKHPSVVTSWIQCIDDSRHFGLHYYGLEIELDNTFGVGTLQLCDGNRCLIFQVMNWPCPPALNKFFGNINNVFIGNHLEFKISKLREKFYFAATATGLDTGFFTASILSRNFGPHAVELSEVKKVLLNVIAMEGMENNWCRPNLTIQQVQHATADAFLNLQILRWLNIISPHY